MTGDVQTCSVSLLDAGTCCQCHNTATHAVLDAELVEHARCALHIKGPEVIVGVKPLMWSPEWAPDGAS